MELSFFQWCLVIGVSIVVTFSPFWCFLVLGQILKELQKQTKLMEKKFGEPSNDEPSENEPVKIVSEQKQLEAKIYLMLVGVLLLLLVGGFIIQFFIG